MNDEVGFHVLLLHFAGLHQVSHARGVPPTPLPQDSVQSTQQGPDVVLHTATNLLSALFSNTPGDTFCSDMLIRTR